MVGFAFLLPFITWQQAVGAAVLCLLFDVANLPHLAVVPASCRSTLPSGPRSAKWAKWGRWQRCILHPRVGVCARILNGWKGGMPALPVILYPLSLVVLTLLYRHHLQIVAGVWAVMALGDGMAAVAGQRLGGPALPHNPRKTWFGFSAFMAAGTLGAYVLTRWIAPSIPPGRVLNICAATAFVGALVESLPIELDDDISVPLVCGGFMFCAHLVERSALDSNLPYLKLRMILAVVVNLSLALFALRLRLVDRSGAAAGWVLGVAVYLGYGYKSFSLLLAFFLLGSMATRLGYAKKAARGIAEGRGGARSWREASANTLAGTFFSILAITTHHEGAFLVALVAAFAEAAGDTVSSEIGEWLSPRAYLITTLRRVAAGENGGVSAVGSAAGLGASALIVALGYGLGLCGLAGAAIAFGAACLGNVADSILGATLEQRGLVTNGIVNFTGTSFAGVLALAVALHFQLG